MNRRGFLGSILAACAAPAIVRAQSLMPGRGIVLATLPEIAKHGNTFASIDAITREALKILETEIALADVKKFDGEDHYLWLPSEPKVIRIRKPQRYTVAS